MSEFGSCPADLRDPRLATFAVAPTPAWLCSADGTRVLWTNAVGAAIFNAPSATQCTIDANSIAARELARISTTLRADAPARLERLRGFGGALGRAVTCACSRLTLPDGSGAILVAATEPAGPRLSLDQRVERLLANCDEPIVVFAPEGPLLYVTAPTSGAWREYQSLDALGASELAAAALATGQARGRCVAGEIAIETLGADGSAVLLVRPVAAAPVDVAVAAAADDVAAPAPDDVTAPVADVEPEAVSPPLSVAERRKPLRFVWQIDADGRFSFSSDEFAALLGPQTVATLTRPWNEAAAALDLDPEQQVARAIASQETWSGIQIALPVDDVDIRVAVELSGLPAFDRDRSFRGYRGFGICRDVTRVSGIEAMRRATAAAPPRPQPEPIRPPPEASPPALELPNVVPFPASANENAPFLSAVERNAFRELANRLSARLRADQDPARDPPAPATRQPTAPAAVEPAAKITTAKPSAAKPAATSPNQRSVLDRLPVGVLVYRLNRLIYANRTFLDWTGYHELDALEEAGGLDALFIEPNAGAPRENNGAKLLTIATAEGDQTPVEARLFTAPWDGESALVLMFARPLGAAAPAENAPMPTAAPTAEVEPAAEVKTDNAELRPILDGVADGVLVLDRDGRVVLTNRSAEALFGYDRTELIGLPVGSLFAPESERIAIDYLESLNRHGTAARGDGREVIGRTRSSGLVPLFMTVDQVADGPGQCVATFRDITAWKKAEADLVNARRHAERASSAKSEFLAKVSHEIRTPLNAILGFAEVMTQERFGPLGNERYAQYLKDIHTSGEHLVALLNDLLDLSKIETGKLDLNFTKVDLNELTQQCVALMQPQANRERIIIRTSLSPAVQPVVADARCVRQIVLNLVSNSIKFSRAGGQIIVSTASNGVGDVVLRVRDTGIGMTEKELAIAMEPFRQLATSARWGSGGSGLGLPLTKALAEANRATFSIKSAVNSGTLVEVAFPGARIAAE